MKKIALLRLSAVLLILITLAATLPAAAQTPDTCAGADALVEMEDYAAAKAIFQELLKYSDTADCAQAGLKRIKALEEVQKAAKKTPVEPLGASLTLVGTLSYPSIFSGDSPVSYAGFEKLMIPIPYTDTSKLAAVIPFSAILLNKESGDVLVLSSGEGFVQSKGVYGIPFSIEDAGNGNGTYSAAIDILPADKDKGAFTIELKLRDNIWWAVLVVFLGVMLSTIIRITYNKWHPAAALEKELGKLKSDIQQKGETPGISNPADPWDRRLKRFSIIAGSEERIADMLEKIKSFVKDYTIASLKKDSEEEAVKELYTARKAEADLLASLEGFSTSAVLPAHQAFKEAYAEFKQIPYGDYSAVLLEKAEKILYNSKEDSLPIPIQNAKALEGLQTTLASQQSDLLLLREIYYRVRICLDLSGKIDVSQLTERQKEKYDEAQGILKSCADILKLDCTHAELQVLADNLDKAMIILYGLVEVIGKEWERFERLSVAQSELESLPFTAGTVKNAIFVLSLALDFYRPLPNLISLVLAIAFALNAHYFGKTFGTWADYLSVFAWGLGVDIATKSVLSILSGFGIGGKAS